MQGPTGDAEPMPLQQIDRLEIQVLVDNVTDSLSSTPPFVSREWAMLQRRGMRRIAGGALCCANHGLSLVITAHGPIGARTLLFDGGPVDYAVERNGMRLDIAFGAIDAVVLSHGHWDHAGGIPAALARRIDGGTSAPNRLSPTRLRPAWMTCFSSAGRSRVSPVTRMASLARCGVSHRMLPGNRIRC
jgi:7,8-dihydropterin-6-yl-methyl-4-(beta-D-ribofuranosyl)aminobenzene 5'-phosphate synthase